MSEIDWSKAPEGATHYAPAIGSFGALWAKVEDGQFSFYDEVVDRWYWGAQPLRHETFIPRPVAWTGAGLPPVGAVCEIQHESLGWTCCEIVAHKVMDSTGVTMAIAWIDANTLDQSQGIRFRPIRTQAQIEAEEREEFAHRLVEEMGKSPTGYPNAMNQARKIYDLGYRKQGEAK